MWPSPGRIEEPPKQNGVFHLPKMKDEPNEIAVYNPNFHSQRTKSNQALSFHQAFGSMNLLSP